MTKKTAREDLQASVYDLLTDSLGYTIRRAQVRTYDAFFEMLGDLEISPARLTALSIIHGHPEITQAELAQRLGIAGPSVVKVVDALEQARLVSREAFAGDRRRYALVLTERGRKRLVQLRERIADYEARIAAELNADERRQLIALLERIAR